MTVAMAPNRDTRYTVAAPVYSDFDGDVEDIDCPGSDSHASIQLTKGKDYTHVQVRARGVLGEEETGGAIISNGRNQANLRNFTTPKEFGELGAKIVATQFNLDLTGSQKELARELAKVAECLDIKPPKADLTKVRFSPDNRSAVIDVDDGRLKFERTDRQNQLRVQHLKPDGTQIGDSKLISGYNYAGLAVQAGPVFDQMLGLSRTNLRAELQLVANTLGVTK